MNASQIMTRNVATVSPETPVHQAVEMMLQRGISGLPVVDAGGVLVGIVTEGDLLRRTELDTQRKRPRWLEFFVGPGQMAEEYVRTAGRKVGEVMTPEVRSVSEDTSLSEVVATMERHRIKRLPVVHDGKVVGILSRANLLRALANATAEIPAPKADDESLRRALLAELDKQPWAPVSTVSIIVRDGVVHLWGSILDERQRSAIRVACENIPGVSGIEDHLVWVEPISGMAVLAPGDEEASAPNS